MSQSQSTQTQGNQNQQFQLPIWATCNPFILSEINQYTLENFVNGIWKKSQNYKSIIDPLNGGTILQVPDTQNQEIEEFIVSNQSCPKSGLHNPLKNPERYLLYGDLCFKIAQELRKPESIDFFARLIQRVMPKSTIQCAGEVKICAKFFENFSGDQTRFLSRSFNNPGDHQGQQTSGYRWPYGGVAIIAPFNFPLEIPTLQLFGAILVGNKPLLKVDSKVSVVIEQFLRMCLYLGMPKTDFDFINCEPPAMEQIIIKANFRLIQFTGSSFVAEKLSKLTNGKVKIEDAGFDWKILGPDVQSVDYVAWQSDQDAYAASGQKCSAQSILYAHENWVQKGIIKELQALAERRNLNDLSIGPVLTWNNEKIIQFIEQCLKIQGSKILFGGKPLSNTKIPACYGSFEPTAIFVPIDQITNNFDLVTTEVFGPLQIITEYKDDQVDLLLKHLNMMKSYLTAAVVSNDVQFINKIVGNTENGVTYTGIRARTTGAPQNHFFGPCGDPRGGGIGSPESILQVWTSHREIITDIGPIPNTWQRSPCN